jgi:DNA polymerase-3 subunit beta
MKIVIERNNLLKSLNHFQGIVEKKNAAIPILSNVKFEAANVLKITGTSVDLELIEAVPSKIVETGSVTIPSGVLFEIIRKLPEGSEVSVETSKDDSKVTIKSDKSKFSLSTLPSADFPLMSGGEMPAKFTIPANLLSRMIDKTKFAISTEETRFYLNGIYFHIATNKNGKKVLRAVATDGHRLALVDADLPKDAEHMPSVIVPRRVVMEMRRMLDDVGSEITVEVSETKARFSFGEAIMTSKLIDGKFPDYERVIPQGNDKVLDVDCKEFAVAVDRVSSVSSEKSRAVKLEAEKNNLSISASAPEAGSGVEDMDVDYKSEEKIEIGFNSRYLLDVSSQITGKIIRFVMQDGASPTLISDLEDTEVIYVLMPMRI